MCGVSPTLGVDNSFLGKSAPRMNPFLGLIHPSSLRVKLNNSSAFCSAVILLTHRPIIHALGGSVAESTLFGLPGENRCTFFGLPSQHVYLFRPSLPQRKKKTVETYL